MTKDDFEWLLSLVEERKKFAKACWECSHCDIFDKCQEENRNYCEKEQTDADIHTERNQA